MSRTVTHSFSLPGIPTVTQMADYWVAWIKALREENEIKFSKWYIWSGAGRNDYRVDTASATGILLKRVNIAEAHRAAINIPTLNQHSQITSFNTAYILGFGPDRPRIGRRLVAAYPYGSMACMRIKTGGGREEGMDNLTSFAQCADFVERVFRIALFTEQEEQREEAWIYREL